MERGALLRLSLQHQSSKQDTFCNDILMRIIPDLLRIWRLMSEASQLNIAPADISAGVMPNHSFWKHR